MRMHASHDPRWRLSSDVLWCSALALSLLGCRPEPVAPRPVQSSASVVSTKVRRIADDSHPALAYCVPHVPSVERIAFTLDYDGSDGAREPRFNEVPVASSGSGDTLPSTVTFSAGAHGICQAADRSALRRYVLRVPIVAEPRRLDEFVRFGARRGYDQPIFKVGKTIVAAQIANAEYTYAPTASIEGASESIGTATIEANADGRYELRARMTDGYEASTPIGVVSLPASPNLGDCENQTADAVRQLCGHESRPCERVTLVGVNDIGALLSVLGYIESVTELPLPQVAFEQRHVGLDSSPYLDASFRRAHRVRRFFASKLPETELRKLSATESLAKQKVGLHGPIPTTLAALVTQPLEVQKSLTSAQWAEFGKVRVCDPPGRGVASLVVDKNDQVRSYAERTTITERSEVLLRAYYDEARRLRLVVNSETTDDGEAWDAYLVLNEEGCPVSERIATRSEVSAHMLHWELRQLVDPRAAYAEPLCMGQLP